MAPHNLRIWLLLKLPAYLTPNCRLSGCTNSATQPIPAILRIKTAVDAERSKMTTSRQLVCGEVVVGAEAEAVRAGW